MTSQETPINGHYQQIDCDWSLPYSSAYLVMQEIGDGPFYIEKADKVQLKTSTLYFSFHDNKEIMYVKEGEKVVSFIKLYANEIDCKKGLIDLKQSRSERLELDQPLDNTPKETSDGQVPCPQQVNPPSATNIQSESNSPKPTCSETKKRKSQTDSEQKSKKKTNTNTNERVVINSQSVTNTQEDGNSSNSNDSPTIPENAERKTKTKKKKKLSVESKVLEELFKFHLTKARQKWSRSPESLVINDENSSAIKELLSDCSITKVTKIVNRLAVLMFSEEKLTKKWLSGNKNTKNVVINLDDQKRLKEILMLIHSVYTDEFFFTLIKNKIITHGRHLADKYKKRNETGTTVPKELASTSTSTSTPTTTTTPTQIPIPIPTQPQPPPPPPTATATTSTAHDNNDQRGVNSDLVNIKMENNNQEIDSDSDSDNEVSIIHEEPIPSTLGRNFSFKQSPKASHDDDHLTA